ncbi:hypothetical protein [Thermus scotoductus]|uniref:HEAT repeat domain-containing protein n=1 Tax=Thermus scotoductus TaxID=37636 RepID=A0A430R1R5_THESC|nr:hypothetical protein [Thermus scotoductus]RTG93382.1 hypothetical protein CSW49_10840 [Thermus scotoductus]RTH01267.1 hypothetical protein CSW45_10725 [Thermus scotoductus]RTH17153.1 hypothetical protein CSW42_11000 [Thermus scotoductus]RTH97399.1 hypothetical protein CSW28_10865 [Thermus scotoductus]RTI18646.1 hypothetical protein CSW21_10565 [Thermus scotoductus]
MKNLPRSRDLEILKRLARDPDPKVWEAALERLPKEALEEVYQQEMFAQFAGEGNWERLEYIEEFLDSRDSS